MTWIDSLTNGGLRSQTLSALADQSMSYTEMLAILSSASASGLTSSEYADLQSIYTNIAGSFASSYLQRISYNVIYSNPANATWWGGAKTASATSSLGNLQANSSELNVGRLIGEWFLGTDLPMPVSGGDTATGQASSASYNYAKATGSLFVGGVGAADINQGSLGDCYLLAVMGSVAKAKPSVINDLFTDVGNGVYGVRFYDQNTSLYTTVNSTLPVTNSGTLAFGGNVSKSTSGELWVGLVEKAYAQMNAQFDVNNNYSSWNRENSYQVIEGGWAQPIKQLTNLNYKYYTSYYQGISDSFDSGEYYSASASTYKQTIINALNNGAVGWLGSWGNTTGSNGKSNFVAGHAFMLLSYNASTDKFVIRNPWGGTGGGSYNVEFEASIDSFWNSSVKALVALSDATITDPVYSYTLSNDSSSTTSALEEGNSITVSVTRSSSGTSSTVYLSTLTGTASTLDYAGFSKQAMVFAANETVKTIKVITNQDSLVEGAENFSVALYRTANDTSAIASTTANIKDATLANYTYSLSNSANTAAGAVSEGSPIVLTLSRNGQGKTSTVYLSTQTGTATSGTDTQALNKFAVTFSAYETSKTINLATYLDTLSEGVESLSISLFKTINDSAAVSTQAYLQDFVTSPYSYVLISSAGTLGTSASEGGVVSFSVIRAGSGSSSTVYVSTTAGTAGTSDYAELNRVPVIFQANQTAATVNVSTNNDWWLEATEYFGLALYEGINSTGSSANAIAYIKDAPTSTFNYTVSSNYAIADSAITEGGALTFTITRSGKGVSSTVYIQTASGTAIQGSDFVGLTKQAITFEAEETTKTVTVQTLADNTTETTEYLLLNLYRNNADTALSTYAQAYIKDLPLVNYNYSVKSSASSISPVTEGGNITFTITRSGSGSASVVYASTSNGTASGNSDYATLSLAPVSFAASETTKTITISTYTDSSPEGTEYFWLDLYKSYADADSNNYTDYASGYIKDAVAASYSYTVVSSAQSSTPVTEGGNVTFTITRSSSGSASSVFVITSNATATAGSDYVSLGMTEITFAANETSKTITVKTNADALAEGVEYFWLDLYKSSADAAAGNYSSYASAYVKDAVTTTFTYSVSSSANYAAPVAEGGTISFTISRSGTGAASMVYVSTSNGTASAGADYAGLAVTAVNFAANETTKTIAVKTYIDSVAESSEFFWLDLYKTYADVTSGSYNAFASGYIRDGITGFNILSSLGGMPAEPLNKEFDAVAISSAPNQTAGEFKNLQAFAVSRTDGSVVTWGANVSLSADQASKLNGINPAAQIYSNPQAFAALMKDGSVVTWGDEQNGGNSSSVAAALSSTVPVKAIYSTSMAFAALRSDGSVVTWGNANYGGATSTQSSQLNGTVDVVSIASNSGAFAATRIDGSVVTWGLSEYGGNSTSVSSALNSLDVSVVSISSTYGAFAALRSDGSVVAWGAAQFGGNSSTVATSLNGAVDVVHIAASNAAFAAVLKTGNVVTWGDSNLGGDSSSVSNLLAGNNKITSIASTTGAFAALRNDGSVVTWGYSSLGGDSTAVESTISGINQVVSIIGSKSAFAALQSNGAVVTWGAGGGGGDSSFQASALNGSTAVRKLYATDAAFAALRTDGSVVTWGGLLSGGDSTDVSQWLNGDVDVIDIWSTGNAFAALRTDGKVITWGDASAGGNSSAVTLQLTDVVAGSDIFSNTFSSQALTVVNYSPSDDSKNVLLNRDISIVFSSPVQFGNGTISLKTNLGVIEESYSANSSQVSISNKTLTINPGKDLKVFTDYTIDFEGNAIASLDGNIFQPSVTYNFKTQTLDSFYHFFIIAFDAAPGVTYMQQIAEAYNYGMNVKAIVNAFVSKQQFTSVYSDSLTKEAFASLLVNNVAKNTATDDNKNGAAADIVSALNYGMSRGDVIYEVFNNLIDKSYDDAAWGATSKLLNNQTVVAKYLTETMLYSGDDLTYLRGAIDNVNYNSDVSTQEKIIQLIGLAI